MAVPAIDPVSVGIQQGGALVTTALGGIMAAKAAEKQRQYDQKMTVAQNAVSIEAQKGQLQQNLLTNLAANLSNTLMQRAK